MIQVRIDHMLLRQYSSDRCTVKAGDARQVRLVVTTNDQDAIDIVIRRLNPNETSLDLASLQASEHVSDQAFAVTQDSLDIRALAPSTGLDFYIKLLVRAQTSARIIVRLFLLQ